MNEPPPHLEPSHLADGVFDCILFDLDGTLIDTTELIFQSYQHALRIELGREAATDELYLGYGRPLYASFRAILGALGVPVIGSEGDQLVQRLIDTYRAFNVAEHDHLARPFPGISDTLLALRQRGQTLGVVTSKARGIARRGLDLIGLADSFQTLVCQEDSARHKPDPEPLWVALDRLGLRQAAARTIYVGDSTHDLEAGHAAGLRTGAALWGPFPPESLRARHPDFLLAHPGDLLTLARSG